MISAKEAQKISGKKISPLVKISLPTINWRFFPRIDWFPDEEVMEVIFLPDHPELFNLFTHEYCYAIVHPGHTIYRFSEHLYSKYLENLKRLIKYLEKANELSIFFFELYHSYPKDFLPPSKSLIVFTKMAKPFDYTLEKGMISKKKVVFKQDKIYSFLKEIGVKEIRVAGEYVWKPECSKLSPKRRYSGCVKIIASKFKEKGFKIRGIKDCLFPTYSPLITCGILKELYKNQLEIPYK